MISRLYEDTKRMAIALDNLTLTAEQLRAEHRRAGPVDHVRLRRGATSAPPKWATAARGQVLRHDVTSEYAGARR
jgi:hypothetical protein